MTEKHFVVANGITLKYDPEEIDIESQEVQDFIRKAVADEKVVADGAVSIYRKNGVLVVDLKE